MNKSFINNGYMVIRNAFSENLHKKIQDLCLSVISKKNKEINYKSFCSSIKTQKNKLFNISRAIHNKLIYERIFQQLFTSKKFYSKIVDLLGKDLSFLDEPSVTINLPKNFLKKNYYFKDWHQEIWSGADTSSIIMWTPIFQKDYNGQIEVAKTSHNWGHIPHRNRKPLVLPDKFKTFKTNLNYTDIIIMHSMLLHRSLEINGDTFSPRLALPCMIRNFKFKNNAFENNKTWKIFNYSEFTHIERKLGNSNLSPYRLKDYDFEDIAKGSI